MRAARSRTPKKTTKAAKKAETKKKAATKTKGKPLVLGVPSGLPLLLLHPLLGPSPSVRAAVYPHACSIQDNKTQVSHEEKPEGLEA